MINSTTGRMATEHWVNCFCTFLSYDLGILLEKVEGIFKSGCGRGVHFPLDLMTS